MDDIIEGKCFDEERALYGQHDLTVRNCRFDGPADGESAFKEARCIKAEKNFYNLRYPFWHCTNLELLGGEMTDKCRAALWYSKDVKIEGLAMHGIKAVRECENVQVENADIDSPEFGWFTRGMSMAKSRSKSEYFKLKSSGLNFSGVEFSGKYSFQYVEDSVFENCNFDTKDAFWHAKNVLVKNCTVKGEYLAWYCENVTFENCTICGTQPLCYCKGLKLVNCKMYDADLAFEKSEVQADITTRVESIKNPLSGCIKVAGLGALIRDDPASVADVLEGK